VWGAWVLRWGGRPCLCSRPCLEGSPCSVPSCQSGTDVDVIIHACPNLQAWCRTRLAFIWLNPLLCVGSLGLRHQSGDISMGWRRAVVGNWERRSWKCCENAVILPHPLPGVDRELSLQKLILASRLSQPETFRIH
jgi:hypothetical protein